MKSTKSQVLFISLFLLILPCMIQAETPVPSYNKQDEIVSVTEFGAKRDGKTDDTQCFQKALDAVGKNGLGGVVMVPRGTYMVSGHLNIPDGVSLEGIWEIPTAWSEYKGSTLLVTEGEGNADGTPFITLHANSVIKGMAIFYPNQGTSYPPKVYPWTIASSGEDNSSIIDVLIVNPYQAVDFGTHPAGRHYIRNLYAQPIWKGLYVDQCYDIGRVENVHFWPFWTCNDPKKKEVERFIAENGEAFIFGRTDWEYVFDTFSWGYKVGYHFIKTRSGYCNGNFLGIGADATQTALLVEDCAPYGLLITNGEFVSFLEPHPTAIVIKETNTGVIQLQNCAFWGPAEQIATVKGDGTLMMNNCNFIYWDAKGKNQPAIEAYDGNLILSSNNFNKAGADVVLHENVKTAVISSNRFAGKMRIVNESKGDVQIGLNTSNRPPKEESNAIVIDDSQIPPVFHAEGEWNVGMGGKDYLGLVHWALAGKGDIKASWQPDIPTDGIYNVYLWYGGDPSGDHATNAPFLVKSEDGEKKVSVNFRTDYGKWNSIGIYHFAKGTSGYVMVSNDADGQIIADAVKFVPEFPQAGKFKKIYDPSIGEKESWYINDHCFVYGNDSQWHLFGITHQEPANPMEEKSFAHAISSTLTSPAWLKQPMALQSNYNKWKEIHLWAPYVIYHDGLYYMYYCAGDKDHTKYKIHLATSPDLKIWTRHPTNPMIVDGYDARDPFIFPYKDGYLMYYTATEPAKGGNHIVACQFSTDLIHWKNRQVVFTDPSKGTWGGPTESPFVVKRGKYYYLFNGPRDGYVGTDIFRSDDPMHWEIKDKVGHINSHALEVIRDKDGKWYVSSAGWGQGGVYIAPLDWHDGQDDSDSSIPIPGLN